MFNQREDKNDKHDRGWLDIGAVFKLLLFRLDTPQQPDTCGTCHIRHQRLPYKAVVTFFGVVTISAGIGIH